MRFIVIYGPPAVGKLTTAEELSKLTGYRIFHNHLTIDLVNSILDYGSKEFNEFVDRYRLEMIGAAAKNKVKGLIFTFVYANVKGDNEFLKKVVSIVKKNKGRVHFVQLYTNLDVLKKRLKDESRKKYSKMKRATTLQEVMKKYDLFEPVSFAESFKIDNTSISAKNAAKMIKVHYQL
jgi:shikimate kinase